MGHRQQHFSGVSGHLGGQLRIGQDGHRSLTDRRRHPFHRATAHVTRREHTGPAGFQLPRLAPGPATFFTVAIRVQRGRAGRDEAVVVELDDAGEPRRVGHGTDEDEQRPRVDRLALALHHLPGLGAARRARHSAAVLSSPRPTRSALQIQAISPWLGSGPDGLERRLHRRGLEPAARAAVAVLSCAARIRGGSGRQPAGRSRPAHPRKISVASALQLCSHQYGGGQRTPTQTGPNQAHRFSNVECRAGDRSGRSALPTYVPKYSWIWRIAIDPSPTAEATRLTEPLRTSPAANTPGWLVSSIIG